MKFHADQVNIDQSDPIQMNIKRLQINQNAQKWLEIGSSKRSRKWSNSSTDLKQTVSNSIDHDQN